MPSVQRYTGTMFYTKYYSDPCLNKFNALTSCGNEEVVTQTAMYLFNAFEKRQTMFNE